MSFSERMGIAQARDSLQIDNMDEALRTSLYNAIYLTLDNDYKGTALRACKNAWMLVLHEPIHKFEYYPRGFLSYVQRYFNSCAWYEVYDLVEYLANELPGFLRDAFAERVNVFLENDGSGYRLHDGLFVPITDESELAELDASTQLSETYSGARMHMRAAIEALSARPEPDLRKAVNQAISAVESAAKVAVDDEDATLGKALVALGNDKGLHPALVEAWKKMYGFTSDEGGLRHGAMTDQVNLDFPLAKCLVVTCAAFVNYLVASQVVES